MDTSELTDAESVRLRAEIARLKRLLQKAEARVQRLEKQADIDPLVPVYNRRAFMREAQRVRSYCRRYEAEASIIYIDITGFKQINDTYGHAAGDAVLLHLAATLEATTRESDIVGRLGGDEFGVIVRHVDGERAGPIAERLMQAAGSLTVTHDHVELRVGISAGVAQLDTAASAQDALDEADQKMYSSRQAREIRQ